MSKLELQTLNKHYGKKHALKNFSFTFQNGVYGLLGPNGAGKSTLMNLITDNLKPDKDGGQILWEGTPVQNLGKNYRSRLGFMPQQQELYANMTAQAFLDYICALKGIPKKSAKEEVQNALEQVELSQDGAKKIGGFSGGMKQRLLIAQTLLGNPDLIIMDEPTAGLDPRQRIIIRNLTDRLGQDKIILISTHIISDIEIIADEILLIQEGELLTHGTVSELVKRVEQGEKTLENLYMQYYGGDANAAC
jgi:ABC-2 type transport system ATP-binding protein